VMVNGGAILTHSPLGPTGANISFFLVIIGCSEAFSEHRFQVFRRRRTRFQTGSHVFTTDTSCEILSKWHGFSVTKLAALAADGWAEQRTAES
jgi:hypothetical protein